MLPYCLFLVFLHVVEVDPYRGVVFPGDSPWSQENVLRQQNEFPAANIKNEPKTVTRRTVVLRQDAQCPGYCMRCGPRRRCNEMHGYQGPRICAGCQALLTSIDGFDILVKKYETVPGKLVAQAPREHGRRRRIRCIFESRR